MDPLAYAFDYDNDGSYESTDPTHTFPVAGTYTVGVRVDDGDGGRATTTTTVDVTHANPTTPTDSNTAANTVVEGGANGATVGLTVASTQLNGLSITYSLTDDAGGRFAINSSSGVVTVAYGSLLDLDFETATSHTVTVQASDGQGGTSTADFTIGVTNADPSQPTDADATINTVVEGAPIETTVGVTASASDVNGPAVTYSLRGKCQYIPNTFVPIHPEQQRGYNRPHVIPTGGNPMSKQRVKPHVVKPW